MNDNDLVQLSGWLSKTPLGFCLWFRDGGGALLRNWRIDDALIDHPVFISGLWCGSRLQAERIELDAASNILWSSARPECWDGAI
jgi:hypothetical protein